MQIIIPDEFIKISKLSETQLMTELAMALFSKNLLTFGQARKLSGLDVISFQEELGKNKITMHYDLLDFEQDLINLENFGK